MRLRRRISGWSSKAQCARNDWPGGVTCGRFRFMNLRMEVFHGKEGLLKLAPAWGKLKDRVRNRRHFHRVEWYLALAETFETFGPAGSLICFGFFSSGDLVSALPFRPIQIDVAGIRLRAMQL